MVLSGKRSRFISEVVIIEYQKQPLVVVIAPKYAKSTLSVSFKCKYTGVHTCAGELST